MGEGREGGTKDIAKPGYSTCNRCSKQDETVRLVVRAKQMGFEGLLE